MSEPVLEASKKWLAPAKLNLFLQITGRRDDGYHELQTVFQIINLCDELLLKVRRDGILSRSNPIQGVVPEEDLTIKAARLLQVYSGTSLGVDISIEKNIPMGAGLGGGSSDAATALVALNHLWGLRISIEKLAKLAVTLGADVPVFVYGKNAWAEGIGEKITPIVLLKSWYVIFIPAVHVSTAKVFMSKELTRDSRPIKISRFLQGYAVNTLERVVFNDYSAVGRIAQWIEDNGKAARMSGTGCAVFVAFPDRDSAQTWHSQVWDKNRPEGVRSFVVEGCNESPLNIALNG